MSWKYCSAWKSEEVWSYDEETIFVMPFLYRNLTYWREGNTFMETQPSQYIREQLRCAVMSFLLMTQPCHTGLCPSGEWGEVLPSRLLSSVFGTRCAHAASQVLFWRQLSVISGCSEVGAQSWGMYKWPRQTLQIRST